jgi:hypothetical protein
MEFPAMECTVASLSRRDPQFADRRRRILVLYDHHYLHVKTIVHYLESFQRYSEFAVSYVSSVAPCEYDLDYFDAVVIHYSVKVAVPGHLSASFAKALSEYCGAKAIFLHDEYEATDATSQAIADLGIGIVFTCVPEPSIPLVYPPERFANVEFVNVLTGYVAEDIDVCPAKPTRARPIAIGYRGRNNAYWFGDLYQEKVTIGKRMKEICDRRSVSTDIAWREEDRIYGDDWFRFLGSCKATLGTESGSNVFDRDGALAIAVERELMKRPAATYEEIHARFLKHHEGKIVMNQISPKIFEAIACRTALILFEGHYSGVLVPDRHYIALKKDFSNVDDVLRRVGDDDGLEAMARRAYEDLIRSGRYSYRSFVRLFDKVLSSHLPAGERGEPAPWLPLPPCDALAAFRARYERQFQPPRLVGVWQALPRPLRTILRPWLSRGNLKKLWVLSPASVRRLLRPLLHRFRALLHAGPVN